MTVKVEVSMAAKVAQSCATEGGGEEKDINLCGAISHDQRCGGEGGQASMTAKAAILVSQKGGGRERHYTVEGNGRWVIALSEALRSCIIQPS